MASGIQTETSQRTMISSAAAWFCNSVYVWFSVERLSPKCFLIFLPSSLCDTWLGRWVTEIHDAILDVLHTHTHTHLHHTSLRHPHHHHYQSGQRGKVNRKTSAQCYVCSLLTVWAVSSQILSLGPSGELTLIHYCIKGSTTNISTHSTSTITMHTMTL